MCVCVAVIPAGTWPSLPVWLPMIQQGGGGGRGIGPGRAAVPASFLCPLSCEAHCCLHRGEEVKISMLHEYDAELRMCATRQERRRTVQKSLHPGVGSLQALDP